jgi:hypothetical protein
MSDAPELILLSFSRAEFVSLHRAALKGDEEAVQAIETMWDDYRDRPVECLLCATECRHPWFTMMLPDHVHAKLVAAPLCPTCRDLPTMVRWHRCLKLIGKMHSARTGKQVHFDLMSKRRR